MRAVVVFVECFQPPGVVVAVRHQVDVELGGVPTGGVTRCPGGSGHALQQGRPRIAAGMGSVRWAPSFIGQVARGCMGCCAVVWQTASQASGTPRSSRVARAALARRLEQACLQQSSLHNKASSCSMPQDVGDLGGSPRSRPETHRAASAPYIAEYAIPNADRTVIMACRPTILHERCLLRRRSIWTMQFM